MQKNHDTNHDIYIKNQTRTFCHGLKPLKLKCGQY
jgi:hypothetical protein